MIRNAVRGCRRTHARTPVSCRLLNVVGMATPSDECSVPTLGKTRSPINGAGISHSAEVKSSTCLATMAADRLVMAALVCAFERSSGAVPRTARCHLISVACPTRTRYARMLCVLRAWHEDTRTASRGALITFRIFRQAREFRPPHFHDQGVDLILVASILGIPGYRGGGGQLGDGSRGGYSGDTRFNRPTDPAACWVLAPPRRDCAGACGADVPTGAACHRAASARAFSG
jgi:hypothetical protein